MEPLVELEGIEPSADWMESRPPRQPAPIRCGAVCFNHTAPRFSGASAGPCI